MQDNRALKIADSFGLILWNLSIKVVLNNNFEVKDSPAHDVLAGRAKVWGVFRKRVTSQC